MEFPESVDGPLTVLTIFAWSFSFYSGLIYLHSRSLAFYFQLVSAYVSTTCMDLRDHIVSVVLH